MRAALLILLSISLALAPTLFNLVFDFIIATALAQHPHCGVKIPYRLIGELVGNSKKMTGNALIQDLEYADDMGIASDSTDALEEVLRSMNDVCSGVDLSMSSKKTKILAAHAQPLHQNPNEEPVQVVEDFQYILAA